MAQQAPLPPPYPFAAWTCLLPHREALECYDACQMWAESNEGRACTSTVEAGFAARPVPRPRQLADVPRPCLHQRTGLVLVPKLRLQRRRGSVRVHFRLHLGARLRPTDARGRLRLRNDEAVAARVADLRRPHLAVRVLSGLHPFPLKPV